MNELRENDLSDSCDNFLRSFPGALGLLSDKKR